uniref:Uncharacterized protein n=1 Tax=Anguilla anguilla TaxID=7936 RepID=A0A0E9WIF2_ANGAN
MHFSSSESDLIQICYASSCNKGSRLFCPAPTLIGRDDNCKYMQSG